MNKPVENLKAIWKTLAQKIIACLLGDEGAIFPVMAIIKGNDHWWPDKERLIWTAILECVGEMTVPTVPAIAAKLGLAVDLAYIQAIAGLFNDEDNRRLVYLAEQLRDVGILINVKRLGRELVGAASTDDIDTLVSRVTTELAGIQANRTERQSDTMAIDKTTWAEVEAFNAVSIPTGLRWFDEHTGGLWPGMNYWIVAAYKSGKSTIMRNCILAAAQTGHPVTAYCAEGSRESFMLDCMAMLAAGYILDEQPHLREQLRFRGLWIKRHWNDRNRVMKGWEIKALEQARRCWQSLPIRVYDSRDGIKDLVTLHYLVKRDKLKHGVLSAWLDYSQLFGKGTIFEQQRATALKVQDIASSEGVALAALAQKNEEGVKSKGESDSPDVKGGGDAAAAADFLLIPRIDKELQNYLEFKLKFSRHVAPKTGQHVIDPASGLILDRWFRAEAVRLN